MSLIFERGIPMVAASFTDVPVNMDVIRSQGLDIAEIRVDLCKRQDINAIREVLGAFKNAGINTMLTIRSWAQGGRWTRTHEERIDLILSLYDLADIIDIEDDCEVPQALRDILIPGGPLLLVSHHNTKGTPSHADLCAIRERALEKKPDLIKIATHIRKDSDLTRLVVFLVTYGEELDLIIIGMGINGLLSRIEFPKYGSPIVFSFREYPTAPGQLSLDDTVNYLRTFYAQYNEALNRRLQSMEYS